MTIDISILFTQVAVMVLMIFPGFFLAKFGLSTEKLGKGISNIVLYAAQPALLISGYLFTDYNPEILGRMLAVFVGSIVAHLIFIALAFLLFRKAPNGKKQVLMFASIFTNAGYMGIPLLKAIFTDEVAIYGSIYVFVFNVFVWSIGSYIYTGEKKYISVRKMILNPATLSAAFGIVFFVLSAFDLNPFLMSFSANTPGFVAVKIFTDFIKGLEALVSPLAMIIIGLRLAEVNFRTVFKDKWLYIYLLFSMLAIPALIWGITKILAVTTLYTDTTVANIMLLTAAAPAATATSMFAEKHDGDTRYAGVIVSISSVLCVGTMLAVSLLTLIP